MYLLRPFLLALLCAFATAAHAQFKHQLPAPFGFDLRGVNAPSANVLLMPELDDMGGTWRSADGGQTWSSLPFHVSRTVFATDQIGYAFFNADTLLKTTDAGATWSVIEPTGDLNFGTVNWSVTPQSDMRFQLSAHFADEQNGLVASKNGNFASAALYRTADGGQSWTTVSSPDFRQANTVSNDLIWAVDADSVYRSTDGGQNWSASESPLLQLSGREPFIRGIDAQTAYFWSGTALFRTTDGGANWDDLSENIEDNRGIFDAFYYDADTAIVLCDSNNPNFAFGPRRTTDGGQTWEATSVVDFGADLDFRFRNLVVLNDADRTTLMYGRDGLLARSTDQGASWQMLTVPAMFDLTTIRFFDEQNGATEGGNSTFSTAGADFLLRTSNGGVNWNLVVPDLSNFAGDNEQIYAYSPTGAVAVNSSFNASFLVRSTDGGQTWSSFRDLGLGFNGSVNTAFADENTGAVFYGGFITPLDSVARTTNGGQTWTFADVTQPTGGLNRIQMIDANLLFGTNDNAFFASTDGGLTWTERFATPGSAEFVDFQFVNADLGYATIETFGTRNVHKTTDGGQTWIDLGVSGEYLHFSDADNGATNLFNSIRTTADGGATWTDLETPYIATGISNSFEVMDINAVTTTASNTIYLACDRTAILTDGEQGQGPATSLRAGTTRLSPLRAYPNPTRGAVIVDGLTGGDLTWAVYDVQGRRHQRGTTALPASRSGLQLDLSGLPTGVYIVRVTSQEGTSTARVLLR